MRNGAPGTPSEFLRWPQGTRQLADLDFLGGARTGEGSAASGTNVEGGHGLREAEQLHDEARMLTIAELELDDRLAARWLAVACDLEQRLAEGTASDAEVEELLGIKADLIRVGLLSPVQL